MFHYLFRTQTPERFFLTTCFLFSFLFLIFTPPFQSPDSFQHFYRIYQLSEWPLTPDSILGIKKEDQAGGWVPYGLKDEVEKLNTLPFHEKSRTSLSEIFSLLKNSKNLSFYKIQSKEFVSFPNTILYPPTSHLPQIIAFKIASFLDFTLYQTYYFICFFKFIFCLFFFYIALTFAPLSMKWAIVCFAILPMNIFLLPTLSPDSFIIALSFLIFTLALHPSWKKKKFFTPLFLIFSFFLAFSKLIYIFVPFVIYCHSKVQFKKFNIRFFLLLSTIVILPSILWSLKSKEVFVPLVIESLPKDPTLQMDWILSHPTYFWNVFLSTLSMNGGNLLFSMIGTFGWMDTFLPKSVLIFGLFYLGAVSFISMGSPHSLIFNWRDKTLTFGIITVTYTLMFLSLLLTATVVGGTVVHGLQGRYFLGLLPMILILTPRFVSLYKIQFILPWMVRIGALVLLVFSIYTVIDRFYLT